jgi:hypothetical protein
VLSVLRVVGSARFVPATPMLSQRSVVSSDGESLLQLPVQAADRVRLPGTVPWPPDLRRLLLRPSAKGGGGGDLDVRDSQCYAAQTTPATLQPTAARPRAPPRHRKPLPLPTVLLGRVTVSPPTAPMLDQRTTVLCGALASFLLMVASITDDERASRGRRGPL